MSCEAAETSSNCNSSNSTESTGNSCPPPLVRSFTRKQVTTALRKKCCDHNDWDNVRVAKGLMTLRCRACQKQWRAAVDMVWGRLKCANFGSEEGCSDKPCSKLHIHNRKLSLEARVRQHGGGILSQISTTRVTKDTLEKIKKLEVQITTSSEAEEVQSQPNTLQSAEQYPQQPIFVQNTAPLAAPMGMNVFAASPYAGVGFAGSAIPQFSGPCGVPPAAWTYMVYPQLTAQLLW
eukprot:TRINITY_DN5321_c0_g1_i1.p1 TRINITY_DN5321_c0_g1~~TRINITY_DN5321_c0_g1_i1.p1  ORF type:complete len:235 (+),score=33.50 TRINITY_DN5321_c0_g1_i1:61-765(+)